MPERNSEIPEVVVSQMGKYGDVNFIFGKTLRVLPETKLPKPGGNLLHVASRFTGHYPAGRTAYPLCEANVVDFARRSI